LLKIFLQMKREFVASSVIRSFGYDAASSTLEIEFNSGAIWHYLHVPARVYNKMRSADSYGEFFNEWIKDRYTEVQVR